jgi:pilus assembly protein CpaF
MIKLTLTEKGGEPKLLTFDKDEITVGRVSGNDIVLAKGNVSKRHSRFTVRSDGQLEVADLKSTNGTYVNGRKISAPLLLSASDRIYVGDFLISVDLGGGDVVVEDYPTDSAHGESAAPRMPVPPPPPPPRAGSSTSHLPARHAGSASDTDGQRHAQGEASIGAGDDEDLGLAAHPPRSGRVPIPPPPPPPRRPATPLASRALTDSIDEDLGGPAAHTGEGSGHEEETGSVGLFAHSRSAEDDADSGGRRAAAAGRPGVPSPGPTFAVGSAAVAAGDGEATAGFDALLADPSVTQILITSSDNVLVDRGSGLAFHPASLGDPNAVADALWRLANTAFPPPAPDNPVVDVRLADGTRLSAVFPPAAPAGVVASIRRPVLVEHAIADLIPGSSKDALALFESAMATRRNLLVTGDVTALPHALGALSAAIAADRRVVAIGAALPGARGGWMDLAPSADMSGLLRVAATLRPEHLLVGEVIGSEVGELLLVAARGQDGLVAALPGRSPADTLSRLVALATIGLGAPASAAVSLVAGAFDLVVQVVSASDGSTRIVEIAEPRAEGASIAIEVVLAYHGEGGRREPGSGRLQGPGVSARLGAALAAAGRPLPPALVSSK